MSLKDSINSAKDTAVRSYASLSREELIEVASQNTCIDSIRVLRQFLNRSDNRSMLTPDYQFCLKIRGEFLMGRLR
jgi:hypothetical protein